MTYVTVILVSCWSCLNEINMSNPIVINIDETPQHNNLLQQTHHISRVAVRAPPFWKENPALWFRQLESQFQMNGITASETKYHIAVAALDKAVINQVSDVVMDPPAANIMYATLKAALKNF